VVLLDDDDDDDDEDDEEDDSELLLSELLVVVDEDTEVSSSSSFLAACACARIILGAFFKNSRKPSVNGPNPIEVKKLMAYRVLRTLSFGNISLYHSTKTGSSVSNLSLSLAIPMASAISCTKILTKIRDDEVVSSSFK
jgi:hypothetical protein